MISYTKAASRKTAASKPGKRAGNMRLGATCRLTKVDLFGEVNRKTTTWR